MAKAKLLPEHSELTERLFDLRVSTWKAHSELRQGNALILVGILKELDRIEKDSNPLGRGQQARMSFIMYVHGCSRITIGTALSESIDYSLQCKTCSGIYNHSDMPDTNHCKSCCESMDPNHQSIWWWAEVNPGQYPFCVPFNAGNNCLGLANPWAARLSTNEEQEDDTALQDYFSSYRDLIRR